MSRQQKKKDGPEERVEVLDSAPLADLNDDPLDPNSDVNRTAQIVQTNEVVADARVNNPPPPEVLPVVRRFRVTKGGMISEAGYRAQMRPGKEVDSNNYDIERLKQQGIELEEITRT